MGTRGSKFFGIAAGLALAALAAPVRAEDLRLALEASNKEFAAAASKGDGASLALLYTPDGQLLPFGSEVVSGTKQIQKFWQDRARFGDPGRDAQDPRSRGPWHDGSRGRAVRAARPGRQAARPGEVHRDLEARRREVEAAPRHLDHQPAACQTVDGTSCRPSRTGSAWTAPSTPGSTGISGSSSGKRASGPSRSR